MSSEAAVAAAILDQNDRTPLAPKTLFAPPPAENPPDLHRTVSEARRPAAKAQARPPPSSPEDGDGIEDEPLSGLGAEEVVAGSANNGQAAPHHAVVITDIDGNVWTGQLLVSICNAQSDSLLPFIACSIQSSTRA
eukprot:SAG31_NODE_2927_length_4900_cov_42.568314_3_plen_136_part_00